MTLGLYLYLHCSLKFISFVILIVWQTSIMLGICSSHFSQFSFHIDIISSHYQDTLFLIIHFPTFWLLGYTRIHLFTHQLFSGSFSLLPCTCFYLLYLYPWSWQYLMVPQSPFLWWQWQLFFQMAHGMTQHVVQSGILQVWESFKTEIFWARVSSSKFISFPLPFPCVLMCLRFSKAGLEVTFILVLS